MYNFDGGRTSGSIDKFMIKIEELFYTELGAKEYNCYEGRNP